MTKFVSGLKESTVDWSPTNELLELDLGTTWRDGKGKDAKAMDLDQDKEVELTGGGRSTNRDDTTTLLLAKTGECIEEERVVVDLNC